MFGWVIVGDISGSVWTVLLARRGVVDDGVWRKRHNIRRIAHTVESERSEDILFQDGASYIAVSGTMATLAQLQLASSIKKMWQPGSLSARRRQRQTMEEVQQAAELEVVEWMQASMASAFQGELECDFLIGPEFDTPTSAYSHVGFPPPWWLGA